MSDSSKFGQIVVNPYSSPHSKSRKGLMASGSWQPAMTEFIKSNQIEALYLNTARGWKSSEFDFLRHLNFLKELHIICGEANGLESVGFLSDLREFSITTSTKSVIDFSRLKSLEKCFLYWWEGASGILNLQSLKELHVDKIPPAMCGHFAKLSNLESLTIANCNVTDVDFLCSMAHISKLELLNCKKIISFAPIAKCKQLKWLNIDGSKQITNIEFVRQLDFLEVLLLSDNGGLHDLSPLSELICLKTVAFAGSTNILDGNLAWFERLPKLAMLMFAPRKHYSHKLIKAWDWRNFDQPDILLKKAN